METATTSADASSLLSLGASVLDSLGNLRWPYTPFPGQAERRHRYFALAKARPHATSTAAAPAAAESGTAAAVVFVSSCRAAAAAAAAAACVTLGVDGREMSLMFCSLFVDEIILI